MWAGGLIPDDYGCDSYGPCVCPDAGGSNLGQEALFKQRGSTAASAAQVGVSTAAAGTQAAMAMITAAGTAAAVPVAGWIAAGVLTLAAGTVALVGAISKGKIRKAEAIKVAEGLGLPSPKTIPAFVVRALKWDEFKVQRKLKPVKRKYLRYKRRGKLKTRRGKKAHAKYELLRAILKVQRQNRKDTLRVEAETSITERMPGKRPPPPTAPPVRAPIVQASASQIPFIPILIGGGALLLLVVAMSAGKRDKVKI